MKFTDIVEFSGKTCSTFDGKKNYISTGCVHDDHICKDEIETVEYINKPSRANLVVEPGDILFAKMQATKKTLLINEDLSQNIYSTGFYAVKPKDGLITKKCLFYLINSSLFLGEKDKNCSGATQKAINNQGLSSIELNIPEFSVQKLLTQKLDVLSKVIEVKQSQIRFFDNLIKARFVEMFGDRFLNTMNWPTKKLGECATFRNGKAHEKVISETGQYVLITSRAIASDLQDVRRTDSLLTPLATGDIVMVMSDVPNGKALAKCLLITENEKYTLNQRICSLSNYDLNPVFFTYLLNRHQFFLSFNDGNGQTNLRKDDILNCPLIRPSIELQNQFANFVAQVDKSKFAVQKSLEKTQLLFDSLMQEYFG